MAGYSPLKITGPETGLVQNRENFLLPDDAYPTLRNAYVWRERIKRKKAYKLLGRLRREFTDFDLGNSDASPWSFNIYTETGISLLQEPNAMIEVGSAVVYVDTTAPATGSILTYNNTTNCEVFTTAPHGLSTGNIITISDVEVEEESGPNSINGGPYTISVVSANSFTINQNSEEWGIYESGGTWNQETADRILLDQGDGTLQTDPVTAANGTINYVTGDVVITGAAGAAPSALNFAYFPGLPVMGIRNQELQNSEYDQTLFFDQRYCYIYNSGDQKFQEYLPGTTWNAAGVDVTGNDFFWSTNYWVSSSVDAVFTTDNRKLFWETNGSGGKNGGGDPPRITDGETWVDFTSGGWHQIDATTYLFNWQCNLPFRGRMVVASTYEGATAATAIRHSNRIRWSTIGNPFIDYDAGPPAVGSWRDDIRGQGGFLDLPTSEDIISIGFVRDNLIVYCQRSTWQLRYTGRSIAPFQIEKVNSELGVGGTFSAVQFDTSLIGIGDRGIIECDSYKADRIDIKIPDFVFNFNDTPGNKGATRVHGIRDFPNRLAYWTIPYADLYGDIPSNNWIFPNTRLVYNYENDSWATFTDSLTTLGIFQTLDDETWLQIEQPWIELTRDWLGDNPYAPVIVGGNQQGFIEQLDQLTTNDPSLFITAMANVSGVTQITSPFHNMVTGTVVQIIGIPEGTPFSDLNDGIYAISVIDVNTFSMLELSEQDNIFKYPVESGEAGTYLGGGVIRIRDNFSIVSKKFNFLDEGQNIQMGYLDILMASTEEGAISMNVYLNYDDNNPSNTLSNNQIVGSTPPAADLFFNATIPTSASAMSVARQGTKFWQRVFCPTRSNFLTIEYTFSNLQMVGTEQRQDVQIDAQVLWIRRAGRMTNL